MYILFLGIVTGVTLCILHFQNIEFQDKIRSYKVGNIKGTIEKIQYIDKGLLLITKDNYFTSDGKDYQIKKARIRLINSLYNDYGTGDNISAKAYLFPVPKQILPFGYDFALYNKLKNIQAFGVIYQEPFREIKKSNNIYHFLHKIRNLIKDRLNQHLPYTEYTVAMALVLGESKLINHHIIDDVRNSGIAHVLCVSGLHLSLVAMFSFLLTRIILNISNYTSYNINIKKSSAFISFLISGFYWLISGMQIASTRAFIMVSCILLSIFIGRKPHPLRSLAVAAFTALCISPAEAINPSFQLSFAAVLILLSSYEFYTSIKIHCSSNNVINRFIKYFIANLYSSIIITILLTPISLKNFFVIQIYGVITNLIAIPLMSFFIMPLALISLLLIPLSLDKYLIQFMGYGIKLMLFSSKLIAAIPGSVLYKGFITYPSIILFILSLFWITLWKTTWRFYAIPTLTISFILMLNTKKPFIIYDYQNNIIAVEKNEKEYEVYSNRFSVKQKQYWSQWLGKKNIIFKDKLDKNIMLETNKKSLLLLKDKEECKIVDYIINTLNNDICPLAENNITITKLLKDRWIMIYK